MSSDFSKEYEVGYKKPPRKNQFKPGQSGNPKGRPKLIKSFNDDLKEESEELLTITENGKKIRTTKQRIFIKKVYNAALSGDKTAMKELVKLLGNLPEKVKEIKEELSESDKAILQEYVERQVSHE